MQFRRSYIPLVPRTAPYSGSLSSRSPRKRSASTQTDKYCSRFENWFEFSRTSRGELALDEETTKAYSSALEYVNSFHSYMNRKLGDRYGERGDTRPEGNDFFRLPEVPNYVVIFLMLLEKTKGAESTSSEVLKGKADIFQSEIEAEETTKESIVEFVPENASRYKLLEETGGLEEFKISEQEARNSLMDDNSVSCATKTRSADLSALPSRISNTTTSEEVPERNNEEESTLEAKGTCDTVYINHTTENGRRIKKNHSFETNQCFAGEEINEKQDEDVEPVLQRSDGLQTVTVNISEEEVNGIMMDIIRERVQEEITTYLDKTTSSPIKSQRPHLVKTHFHVVSIAPQINLLEYAQKKLERQLNSEPRPETARKQFLNGPPRKSPNVGLSKVTTMFRKLSQETFRDFEVGGDAVRCESDESDGDSVILDDEEFEKINGHVDERMDHKQKRNCSGRCYK